MLLSLAPQTIMEKQVQEEAYGGVSCVYRACDLSRKTIHKGLRESTIGSTVRSWWICQPGAGRKKATVRDPQLPRLLEALVEPLARGDPESPLRWTCKSTRLLAGELKDQQHPVSHETVAQLLHELHYSLQRNRKMEEGEDHPDRDAQFGHINAAVTRALRAKQPVISVDTKKKELVGNYENKGRRWHPVKSAVQVNGHDFPDPTVPRAWKLELQRWANESGLTISVCHFPPGTSKWNKVEHRLFSFISSNWRGEPLKDYETIVRLIAHTTTAKGLTVTCRLDRRKYPVGRRVTDEEMAQVTLKRCPFHGEWNYTIYPCPTA